jgi:DNA-binding NtrC family response regulator
MGTPGNILIVDDDEGFQKLTASMLNKAGYTTDMANDAISARTRLQNNVYDLILADLQMPGNRNMEFIHQLPALAEGVPVIIVTGYPSLQTAMDAIGLSVKGYLVKPFEYHVLLSQVRAWIQQAEAERERRRLEEEKNRLIEELQEALNKARTLSGLLPICAACKKIRDDAGYWHQVEKYLRDHADIEFSHSLCPDCIQEYYPEPLKE